MDINMFFQIGCFVLFLLGIRTSFFHLQQWQTREYRLDRLKAHLTTEEGSKKIWNIWFFKGIIPRPQFSGRMLFILLVLGLLTVLLFWNFRNFFWFYDCNDICSHLFLWENLFWMFLIFERTLFIWVGLAIYLSNIPSSFLKQGLFRRAGVVISFSDDVIRIGITGSYGKSSTKEILTHLLISEYGAENVLFNPRNENNEVAIARMILRSRDFFIRKNNKPKFLIIEMGAYKQGEIQKMCDFVQPHYSILTGINNQHLSLFGSQENIQKAKFELAESTTKTVFFNASSPLLEQICNDSHILATKIAIKPNTSHDIKSHPNKTDFEVYGEKFSLPWMGDFFVQNALLCIELCRELGLDIKNLSKNLKTLPPLERALHTKILLNGATLLNDPYSANPDGVIKTIEQLQLFPGNKIFVGIPLIELGKTSEQSHKEIFLALNKINADVFWLKSDYSNLGKEICGNKFKGNNIPLLKKQIKLLSKGDVILLESRLPKSLSLLLS